MKSKHKKANSITHDTELVQAVKRFSRKPGHEYELEKLIARADRQQKHEESLEPYNRQTRQRLESAIFVGHINTDLDSVAGAIGAAALFGGKPAISQPSDTLNGEIRFALDYCGIETPPHFDTIANAGTADVVLVDHTEEKQMVPSIKDSPTRAARIIGVLDHHALAKTFFTSKPVMMDLRPWGSVSTIIAVLFIRHKRFLPKRLACLLLQAILSDTLNLRSVTTTEADRGMVALLSRYAGISNLKTVASSGNGKLNPAYQETEIDFLAKSQFQAKTDWIVSMGAYEMVRGDQKDFSCGPWKFGISVLEVTDLTPVLEKASQILLELRLLKKEKGLVLAEQQEEADEDGETGASSAEEQASPLLELQRSKELDFAFMFVVNVVEHFSVLLICGGRELALARAAFMSADDAGSGAAFLREACPGIEPPGSTIEAGATAMQLPTGYVSRKAQFVPAFFKAIEEGFTYAAKGPVSLDPDADSKYSADDSRDVLQALAEAKQGERQDAGDPYASADPHSPLAAEEDEDQAYLDREIELVTRMEGNLYDDEGRIRRAYSAQP